MTDKELKQLFEYYDVQDKDSLILEQVKQIERLNNVK